MGKKDEVADPEKMILEYMKTQNRPYSANDVFLNLQKKIGKTQVIKLMEEMSKKEKLVEKVYGKAKIYVINQDEFPKIDAENLKNIENENDVKTQELKAAKDRLKEVKSALSKYAKVKSPKELEFNANKLRVANRKLLEQVEAAKSIANGFDSSSIEKNISSLKNAAKEWKNRKRACTEMIEMGLNLVFFKDSQAFSYTSSDLKKFKILQFLINPTEETIMETYNKPVKVFLESVGIEIDSPDQKIPNLKWSSALYTPKKYEKSALWKFTAIYAFNNM